MAVSISNLFQTSRIHVKQQFFERRYSNASDDVNVFLLFNRSVKNFVAKNDGMKSYLLRFELGHATNTEFTSVFGFVMEGTLYFVTIKIY